MVPTEATPLAPTIDYTARDFESAKSALIQYLKDRYPNDFTDFTESQLGLAILELVSYLFANQAFYLDREANERYFATARQRRNIVLMARDLGYVPYLASAASVDLVVDTTSLLVVTGDIITVNRGQKLTSTGGVIFEVLVDHTLICTDGATKSFSVNGQPTSTTVKISMVQGQSRTFTARSDGQPFQVFAFDQFPVIDGSIVGYVGGTSSDSSAVRWTLVEALPLGDPADVDNQQIFSIIIDENDRATAKFGDNITGAVPPSDATVSFDYRVGGGASGNIAANTLTGTFAATKNGLTAVTLKVNNPSPATGGQDREELSSIRFFAPLWVKTNDRAITEGDYFTLSSGFSDGVSGTIAKAGIIADPTDGLSNVVTVYVWTADSANVLQAGAAQALKDSLRTFLDHRRVVTVYVQVVDGINVPVDVNALVQIDPRFAQADVLTAVGVKIDDIFKEDRVRFGNELRAAWIYDEIMSVPGIRWCHVTSPQPGIESGVVRNLAFGALGSQAGATSSEFFLPTSFDASSALGTTVSSVDGTYCNYRVELLTGIHAGINRKITAYVGSTRKCTIEGFWPALLLPNSGDTFRLWHPRRIAFATTANAATSFYNRRAFGLVGGIGVNQNRTVLSYDGPTRIASIDKNWTTPPGLTSSYTIFADLKCAKSESLVKGSASVTVISGIDES